MGTEWESPRIALGICEVHKFILDVVEMEVCFSIPPQTFLDDCKYSTAAITQCDVGTL